MVPGATRLAGCDPAFAVERGVGAARRLVLRPVVASQPQHHPKMAWVLGVLVDPPTVGLHAMVAVIGFEPTALSL